MTDAWPASIRADGRSRPTVSIGTSGDAPSVPPTTPRSGRRPGDPRVSILARRQPAPVSHSDKPLSGIGPPGRGPARGPGRGPPVRRRRCGLTRQRVSVGSRCEALRQILWRRLTGFPTLVEHSFAYWSGGRGRGTVGAAARRAGGRHDRAPARVGAARARWLLVGLGVLGS